MKLGFWAWFIWFFLFVICLTSLVTLGHLKRLSQTTPVAAAVDDSDLPAPTTTGPLHRAAILRHPGGHRTLLIWRDGQPPAAYRLERAP